MESARECTLEEDLTITASSPIKRKITNTEKNPLEKDKPKIKKIIFEFENCEVNIAVPSQKSNDTRSCNPTIEEILTVNSDDNDNGSLTPLNKNDVQPSNSRRHASVILNDEKLDVVGKRSRGRPKGPTLNALGLPKMKKINTVSL